MAAAEANPLLVLDQHQLTEKKKHFVILSEAFDLDTLHPWVTV